MMRLFLTTLILGNFAFAQQEEAPCLDISSEPVLGNVSDIDPAELMPLVSLVTETLQTKFEGLSASEAAEILPQVQAELLVKLIDKVNPDGGVLNGPIITQAILQGYLNIDNSEEIFREAAKNPQVIVDVFSAIFSSAFRMECFEDPEYATTAIVMRLLAGAVQYTSTLDQLGDIINTTLVTIAIDVNNTQFLTGLLNPVLELLEGAEDLGSLGGLLAFTSDDVFNTAMVSALNDVGVVVNTEQFVAVVAAFNDRIIDFFELDNSEFIPFVVSTIRSIVAALE